LRRKPKNKIENFLRKQEILKMNRGTEILNNYIEVKTGTLRGDLDKLGKDLEFLMLSLDEKNVPATPQAFTVAYPDTLSTAQLPLVCDILSVHYKREVSYGAMTWQKYVLHFAEVPAP
jgi:hypothetical protein